jgi:hypothetical protein
LDLIGFLKQIADPEGEQYLVRFQRLLRIAATRNPLVVNRRSRNDYEDGEDDDDDEGLAWWTILLIVILILILLCAVAYGLYWFFRESRLGRRIFVEQAAQELSEPLTSTPE